MHMSVLDHPVGFGDEMPQDEERLSTLVATLNELADVQTIRACAGHKKPIDSHVQDNEFEVHLAVAGTTEAWASIKRIADACEIIGPAQLSAESDNGEFAFHLFGFVGLEPDDLAATIRANG